MNICWDIESGLQQMTDATSPMPISLLTMAGADDFLQYEPKYKVLICRQHRYAVRNLDRHLRDEHKAIHLKKRRAIVERYARCELREPAEVQLPPPLGPPILALGQPVKALHCDGTGCEFVSINRQAMKKHCNKKHDWRCSAKNSKH